MSDPKTMSFIEHLSELRTRLIRMAIAIFIGVAVGYLFYGEIFDIISAPILESLKKHGVYSVQALQVSEAMMVYLQVSLVAGIAIASPYIFYQIWAFISPGLYSREKRFIIPVLATGLFFFILGVLFCYYVFLPMACDFLISVTLNAGNIQLQPTIQNTFGISAGMLLVFGLIFELPLIQFFLSLTGLITYKGYLKFYRVFIVIAFTIGAIFTPPDVLSQILMSIPIVALYGIGIIGAYIIHLMKLKKEGQKLGVLSLIRSIMVFLVIGGGIAAIICYFASQKTVLEAIPSNAGTIIGFSGDLAVSSADEKLNRIDSKNAKEVFLYSCRQDPLKAENGITGKNEFCIAVNGSTENEKDFRILNRGVYISESNSKTGLYTWQNPERSILNNKDRMKLIQDLRKKSPLWMISSINSQIISINNPAAVEKMIMFVETDSSGFKFNFQLYFRDAGEAAKTSGQIKNLINACFGSRGSEEAIPKVSFTSATFFDLILQISFCDGEVSLDEKTLKIIVHHSRPNLRFIFNRLISFFGGRN
jgi:sec-independent protein translocase protein TatC